MNYYDLPERRILARSTTEELEVLVVEADDQSKPASSITPTDSELVEVLIYATTRLKLDWAWRRRSLLLAG